jgi:Protein of unknown function (DUF2924)
MPSTLIDDIAALGHLSLAELRRRYAERFGEPAHSCHKPHLVRRLAWRLQALAEGGLSERARHRSSDLADEADLRLTAPRPNPADLATQTALRAATVAGTADERLPRPGTILTRRYKGALLQVKVLPHGFEFAGSRYRSLSAVAKAITGSHCNGFLFFRLARKEQNP